MEKRMNLRVCVLSFCIGGLACGIAAGAESRAQVSDLRVEYSVEPLGIDVPRPRFGWQMKAPEGARGFSQSAYQVLVRDPGGALVWDTGKVMSGVSLAVRYAGRPLLASTRYSWSVTAWDQDGATASRDSWFETGLMNPGLAAWDGATWIGGANDDLVLYSDYLSIFDLGFTVKIDPGSRRASFVYGANDPRLMDRNKNVFQVENPKDESYIRIELDVSGVDGSADGQARLNVFRVGYTPTDSAAKPVQSFDVERSVIGPGNAHSDHRVELQSAFGEITITLDGSTSFAGKIEPPPGPGRRVRRDAGPTVNLNPMGRGGDYITFGMLCDMGFALDAGQRASFSDVVVSHSRAPKNVLFEEDLKGPVYEGLYALFARDHASGLRVEGGRYVLDGGADGTFVVADPSRNAMPMLRTVFETAGRPIREARLYVTARGIYEIQVNGARVGHDHYDPGLTQYNKTHMYQTYDVTDMLKPGSNVLGALLGEGWWSGLLSFGPIWNHFGDRQSLLAKLVIRYADGSSQVVTSRPDAWKYFGEGPIRYSSLDLGEVYDATREALVDGWSTAAYDDRAWKPAREVPLQGTAFLGTVTDFAGRSSTIDYENLSLVGQNGNGAGVFEMLAAKSVTEVRKGVYVYDMGQNFVGVPRITFRDGRAGRRVVLRAAEMRYPALDASGSNAGMIMQENYRAALSQDIYVMKDGRHVFQPRFTSRGYQFLEITGIDEPLALEAVEGVAISSIRSLTADYRTSNPKVDRLWSNLVWSNVDNFLSIPTDCPQRNERMGWSGDISVFSRTATYVSNADPFLRRHLLAMRDVQDGSGRFTDIAPVGGGFGGVLWGSAGITVPWEVYQQYGDRALLEEHYDAMAAYVDYLETTLDKDTGLSTDNTLGDWLGPQNNQLGPDFLVTAYHVYDLWIMARTAEVLGREADATRYRRMHEARRAFFNERFVNEDRKTVGLVGGRRPFGPPTAAPAQWKVADTQTSYAVGLALDAFADETRPLMAKALADAVERSNVDDDGVTRPEYSLMTGFIGTAWISKALSDSGRQDLAYRLLQNDRYPSWLYAVDQGATTIWERLNGYTVENGFGGNNSMNSFNHYSFGAVGQWMMAYSLGIQRGEPGFKRFVLQPEPDPTGEMTWARGHYDSMYGRIESAWSVEGQRLTYRATVPANTTATLFLPAAPEAGVLEGGRPAGQADGVRFVRLETGRAVYELESGRYEFRADLPERPSGRGSQPSSR
jgi:alpha-L-rhamnosidase